MKLKRFKVQAPDGRLITIEGPEDATDEELIAAAEAEFQGAPVANDARQPGFFERAQNFARDAVGTVKGGIDAAGDAISGTFREMVGVAPRQTPASQLLNGDPDYQGPSLIEQRGAPVREEVAQDARRTAQLMTPAGRVAAAMQPGWKGSVMAKAGGQVEGAKRAGGVVAELGGDIQDKANAYIEQGLTGEVARSKAAADIMSGRKGELQFADASFEESTGEMTARRAADLGLSALQIPSTVVKSVADLGRLFTADTVGVDASEFMARVNQRIQETKSTGAQVQAAEFARIMGNDAAGAPLALQYLIENPGFAAEIAIPALGSMALPLGAAKAVSAAANQFRWFSKLPAGERLAKVRALQVEAGLAANDLQNAAATFTETDGELSDRYMAAAIAGAGSRLVGRATGGGAEGALIRGGQGRLGNILERGAAMGKAGFMEGGQEFGEAGAQSIGQQLAETGGVDPRKVIKDASVEAALGAKIGAGINVGQQLVGGQGDQRPQAPTASDYRDLVDRTFNAPVRVEQQRTTVITPEEILSAPLPQQDQAGAPPAAGPGTSRATPAAPNPGAGQATTGAAPVAGPIDLNDPNAVLSTVFGAGPAPGVPAGAAGGGADAGRVPGAAGVLPGGLVAGQPAARAADATGGSVGAGLGAGPAAVSAVGSSNAQPQAQVAPTLPSGVARAGEPGLPAAEANAQRVAAANAAFGAEGRPGIPADLKPAAPEVVESFEPVSRAIAEVFGTEQVALAETSGDYDGLNFRGRTVVNLRGMQKPAAFVAAHETVHSLQNLAERAQQAQQAGRQPTAEEADAARIWAPMEAAIWADILPAERAKYATKVLAAEIKAAGVNPKDAAAVDGWIQANERLVKREMLADFSAGQLTDRKSIESLAQREPALFGDFAKRMIDGLTKVIEKLRGTKGGRLGPNNVNKHISDLQKAKLMWQDALIAWRKRGGEKAAPAAATSGEAASHQSPSQSARIDGETDKQFAKRVVDKRPAPQQLPERHADYFEMSGATVLPIADLVSTKSAEENAQGGENGAKRMAAAAAGELAKRGPITVMPSESQPGKYEVVDGNGTLTSVAKYGWQSMPVKMVTREQGLAAIDADKRADKLKADAEAASKFVPKPLVDELLSAIKEPGGAGGSSSAATVVAPRKRARLQAMLEPVFAEARRQQPAFNTQVQSLAESVGAEAKPGPLKAMKRSIEKMAEHEAEVKGRATPADIKDIVRATFVVADEGGIATVLAAIKDRFKVVRVKDRFAKPMDTGYRDMLINVELENGLLAELQIQVESMLAAKKLGHHAYEIERSLPDGDRKRALKELQRRFYDAAYSSSGRGSRPAGGQAATSLSNASREMTSNSSMEVSTTPDTAEMGDPPGLRNTGSASLAKNTVPSGNDDKSITGTSDADTSSDPSIVNLGEQPSASARSIKDHKMVIEREERATIKNVRLSTAESALIDKAADEIASSTGATAKVIKAAIKAELTRKKASYPPSKGWAPLDFKGADVIKDDDGKPVMDDDGKPVIELRYDAIPYNFHVGATGKNDAKTEGVRVEAMAMRLKKAAMELIARRDKGDGAAEVMLRQAGWYKNMRQRLRAEFGGFGDFVADLLGATSPNTPVRTNWEFTIEALKMASNGAYDDIMPAIGSWWAKYSAARDAADSYLQAQVSSGKKKIEVEGKKRKGGGWDRQPDPVYAELLGKAAEASKYDGPEPRRENGKRYGINTDNVLAALGDLWRVVEKGTAPKARNFSGNLIGFRTGATIDVWAARLLRRMANEVINKGGFPRVPPPAEKGVGGKHLTQDSVGGEFGFGQAVFNKAAAMLRASGAPEYANIGDDDLQAIVWFLEKELWTKNNWTTVAGEGGSFEQEADLAGTMERDKVRELRKIIDSSKSSPEMREAARRELANYEGALQRFTGGLSIQQSAENQGIDSVPTDADMASVRQELEASAAGPEMVAFRAFSTLGRYGADERSFDVEGVTRMGYDLAPLHAKMREVAKRANQDSFFTAKALQPGDEVDLTLHRPGIEIFFSQPIELANAEPMLAQLREKGVEFFTFITDGRRTPGALAGAMPKVAGVRMIALPEFMARYGDAEAAALANAEDARVVSYMQQQEDNFRELRNKVDGTPGVSYAEVGHYEVNAEFKEQYDGDETGAPQGGAGPVGGQGWTGLTVREGLARANPGDGAPGAAGPQDGASGLRGNDGQPAVDGPSYSARSDAAGDRRDRGVPEGSEQGSPTYGVATPGAAAPVEAIHFSQQQRASLSSAAYGSGLRGAEMERVMRSSDTRLRQRVYFYVNQGTGIRPESGVGAHAHRVTLANLYDTAKGEIKGAGNDFESAVLDAGYDGYLVRLPGSQSGQAVLLGAHSVPVQYLGLGAPANAAPAPASQAAAASSTRQGDDLVSRAAPDVAAIRGKAEVQAVAPSFRFEFGKARVRADEVEQANAALEQLGSELSFSRRTGELVSPQSTLDAAIEESTRVLEGAIQRGGQMAGLGRTSHVLGMLGARPVPLVMDGSVVRKVFIEKHAGKLEGIPAGDIVRGLYRPAMVFQQKGKPNEYELVLPVVTDKGPLTAAILVDGDRAAVKSIYPRSWIRAESGPALRDFMMNQAASKPVYIDEYLGVIAATGNEDARAEAGIRKKAGSPGDQRPGVTSPSNVGLASPAQTPAGSGNASVARPGAPVNRAHFIAWRDLRALAMKFGRLPAEQDLLRWIGDNYKGDPADAPSFSARQTETPEFKRWFGDSKVVDAEGKPLVVYHGTSRSFSYFRPSKRGNFGPGIYFAGTADQAENFAYGDEGGDNIVPVYLAMQNPYRTVADYAAGEVLDVDSPAVPLVQGVFGADANRVIARLRNSEDGHLGSAVRDRLLEMGHDGIIATYADGSAEYVAFRPDQIKSAIGNNGNFDPEDGNISRSARQPTLWRDELGRLRSPTGKLAAHYGGILNTWLAKVGLNYMSPELKRQFREMKLQLQKAQDVTVAVARESFKMSEAERELVSDIIEGELQTGVVPPSHAVQMAMGMQAVLGQQTDELVALGMLTKESADLWRGKYLPRFYKPKLTDIKDAWSKALQQLIGRKPIMTGIQGKRLKSRGLWETVTHKSLPKWEALGWQVRDPDYDPNAATARTEVQIWRDFTRDEREKMGEIRDAGFRFAMGYQQAQRDIAYGKLFKGIADKIASKREKPGYVQVPDSTVEGTGVKRYGALAGMWVPLEVLQHLKAMDSGSGPAMQMYRKAMSMWKEGKVVLNPVSHANNVLSNISMAHFAGVSFWDQHKYAMAAKELATGSGFYQEAKDAGLMLGTMGREELINFLPPELQALVHQQKSTSGKLVDATFNALTFSWTRRGEQKGLRKWAAKAYEAEDIFFRYMIYRDGRKQGLTPTEAVDHSQRYIFTYDDLPVTAQMIRDFGLPFFAYTYKVIPALLHTAANYPHRLLAPAGVLYALNAAMYALAAGEDDEDWLEKLQKGATDPERQARMAALEAEERENLPPWMKGYVAIGAKKAIRLGTDEVLGLPIFWDVGQIMPGGNLFDMQNNTGGVALPQSLTVSHPLFTTMAAMLYNRDSFFGKDIVDRTDDGGEAALKRTEWLWRQFAPAISFGNYHWERGLNILAQQTGEPVSYWPWRELTGVDKAGVPIEPGYTALQTVGIKVRPVDLDRSAEMRDGQNKALIRDIDKELRNFRRMNQAGYMSDANLERELERAQLKKERLREGLTIDGDER